MDLVYYPDPILMSPTALVDPERLRSGELQQLFLDLERLMRAHDGIGIAAPQGGVGLRIMLVGRSATVLVNPQIIDVSEETSIATEACLSFPKIRANIERPVACTIQALDRDGNEVEKQYRGLAARAVQHEVDHLDGKLFIDYFNSFDRLICETKLKRFHAKYAKAKRNRRKRIKTWEIPDAQEDDEAG